MINLLELIALKASAYLLGISIKNGAAKLWKKLKSKKKKPLTQASTSVIISEKRRRKIKLKLGWLELSDEISTEKLSDDNSKSLPK